MGSTIRLSCIFGMHLLSCVPHVEMCSADSPPTPPCGLYFTAAAGGVRAYGHELFLGVQKLSAPRVLTAVSGFSLAASILYLTTTLSNWILPSR